MRPYLAPNYANAMNCKKKCLWTEFDKMKGLGWISCAVRLSIMTGDGAGPLSAAGHIRRLPKFQNVRLFGCCSCSGPCWAADAQQVSDFDAINRLMTTLNERPTNETSVDTKGNWPISNFHPKDVQHKRHPPFSQQKNKRALRSFVS